MMGRITAGRHIGDPEECTESVIVKRVRRQEVLVVVVTCGGPEVADLLGLEVLVTGKWRAFKRRSWNLQDWQRRSVG